MTGKKAFDHGFVDIAKGMSLALKPLPEVDDRGEIAPTFTVARNRKVLAVRGMRPVSILVGSSIRS
jgi:hypothetical protein